MLSDGTLSDDTWIPLDLKSLLDLQRADAKLHVPSLFYDNETYNRISFEIYYGLLGAFAECGELLENSNASKYLNLVGVFFQEILRILCAYCFKRYELEHLRAQYGVDFDDLATSAPSSFPYVDYDFVINNTADITLPLFEPKKRFIDGRQLARKLLDTLNRPKLSRGKKSTLGLLCTAGIQLDIPKLRNCLNEQGEYSWDVRIMRGRQARVAIPHFAEQFAILEANLTKLGDKLNMGLPQSIVKILEWRTRRWIDGGGKENYRPDVLLTGSLADQEARVVAASMKSYGVPVASIFHGEACGAHDEPIFGYGENTLNDVVIGYGEAGCLLAADGEYSSSLYDDPVTYIPSTSSKANELFTRREPTRLSDIPSPRFMYLPTSFIDSGRYGPYRDMHDVGYMQWQMGLMANAGEMFPDRMVWKPHIKETVDVQFPKIPGVTVLMERRLEDLIDHVDAFMFDYVSTAFTIATATAKPIIFFDIGLRNISSEAMNYIRDRCIYVQASPEQPGNALREAVKLADKRCVNRYTPKLSLSNDRRPRYEVIAESVYRLAVRFDPQMKNPNPTPT